MAEEYNVSLNVDSRQATKGLQDVEKEVNKLDQEFQELVQTMDGDASKAFNKLEDEMLALAQAGKRGTAEYNKLAEMLGRANQATNLVAKDIENLSVSSNDVSAKISVLEDRLYDLAVQGKEDTEEFRRLAKEAGELKKKIVEVDMAVEAHAATNADLGQKVGLLTDKMYRMAQAGDMTSAEFQKTAREAAAAQAQITRVDLALEAMAMTGAMRVQTAMGGVQGAFDMASGAMNLFGIESEAAQKMMMKFQAIMQMTAAVTTMQQALPAITAIKNNVVNGFNSMTQASKAFAVTGIGLAVAAVGAMVAYWDDIKMAVSGVNKETEKLYKQSQKRVEADKRSLELFDLQEAKLRLQGKTEKQIRDMRMEKLKISVKDAQVNLQIVQDRAKSEQKAVENSYKNAKAISLAVIEMMTGAIRMVSVPIDALIWGINKASQLVGGGKVITKDMNELITEFNTAASMKISKFLFDPAETKKKNEDLIHEAKVAAATLEQQYIELQLEIREENKKTGNSQIENAVEVSDRLKDIEQQRIDNMQNGIDKELAQVAHRYKWELNELDAQLKNKEITQEQYDQLRKLKVEAQALDETAIKNKYAEQARLDEEANAKKLQELKDAQWQKEQELLLGKFEYEKLLRQQKFDEEIKQAGDNAELKKLLEQQYYADLAAIDAEAQKAKDELRAQELASDKAAFEEKINRQVQLAERIQEGLTFLSNLNTLFEKDTEESRKKSFKRNKALQIAQATVEMYKNTVAAYGSQLIVGDPSSIPRAVIAATMAATASLVNIRNIAKQQYQGGDSGNNAPSPSSMGTVTTPEFNVVGNANVNALAQLTGQPIQAYVVSGDVTTAQALDRARVNNATL